MDARRRRRGQRQEDVALLPQDVRVVRPTVAEPQLLRAHDALDEALRWRIRQERGTKIEHLSPLSDAVMARVGA
jgi:hypothetical protein